MEKSPLLKISEQDLHQWGLLQQVVHRLFLRVLLQLSSGFFHKFCYFKRCKMLPCCKLLNYKHELCIEDGAKNFCLELVVTTNHITSNSNFFLTNYTSIMIGVLIEDKEFVDSCMGGKPWKAGNFSESLPYTMV
ncbi:hypothetical protein LOK49_LG11G02047 [Camellia lanceoleosa]|uniref:Uncharacterized protein n=1 Tax=Camellia lanceoleosa TaxID=1840588 RepID=A0ACC0G1I6_9ERIC|nr:hypothetical protein LOK49_LG11G02047 [Camellia lanceoleosa]